jgi:bifunctional UDP-N-acetylglucosamine pyrophosphorylase/glucosamine-1-phosphate N-acetyltransferase
MSGVDIENREGVVIAPNTEIRRGTIIRQGTQIGPWTRIREKCEIGPNTFITGGDIEVGCVIKESNVVNSEFEENVRIEPYCRIDSTRIFANTIVGGGTEIKSSIIGMDTKIQGNSYIVNSELGTGVSFGAGAVTVCHGEKEMRRCKIGDNAVIGCNANLVAPLNIGAYGYIAAGSTITDDVPSGALAVARAYQKNRSSWNRRGKKNN